ncbi:alpha-galactosidase [Actinospica sp.]|jgi:alpha-galactosidase|uniref:alpha-galactosidase n=1 Tax=Actinospica sp. TaxID=1872142 RepID=UPI002D0E003C|nr:alpha-galactosidase [Actinospica sp.]HWG24410.1 alpha-galactosidase [Actinospica sp.]
MSTITFNPGSRTWLLSTPRSSYGLQLDATDAPRHLHWGERLTLGQVEALPHTYQPGRTDSFGGRRVPEEIAVDGGDRYGAPGLQLQFADGTRALEWAYEGYEIVNDESGASLRLRMRDKNYPLGISLHYRVYHDSDVIERHLVLDHWSEDRALSVLRADSAGWSLPARANYRVGHVVGDWAAETQLRRDALAWGETVFTSRRGITGHQANPWVMLDAGDADEQHGQVWSAALAWSGSWRIAVQRGTDNRVQVTGGFGHDGVSWRLGPGESLTTPAVLGLYSGGGFGATSRAWHGHVLRHVLPHPREVRPVLYNSWEATGFDVDEAGQRKLAAQAAELGVELFVMDDGWFGTRTSDLAGLGDWTPSAERFPEGLGPLAEEVHRLGMAFGLWVEPEMVNPDSELYRQHPDWVLHFENRERTELRNQLVLNFARPDVAAWAHEWLDRLVSEHAIDFLKWDMNRSFSEAGWPEHGTDGEADRLWIDHVRNVYAIIDRLRADHPNLRIEGCSGGGGRIDLGMLARTDQVWPSDNTDALDRLTIQHGFTQLYPARVMSAWVTDSPNPTTGRTIPLRFRCHAAMSGVMALGGNLTEWSEQELHDVAREVARYKEIRDTVQLGVRHRLSDPDDASGLTAVQYTSTDDAETVVFAWQPIRSFGREPGPVRLAALDPAARYRDRSSGREYDGAVLAEYGLPLELPSGDYASSLTVLERIPAR